MYLAGWGAATGEMSSPLRALVATPDKVKGYGGTNRGRYSNPEMDALIDQALATVDDDKREALLQQASQVVIEDYGFLPLHFEVTPWAIRKAITYLPRAAQYTLALGVTPPGPPPVPAVCLVGHEVFRTGQSRWFPFHSKQHQYYY